MMHIGMNMFSTYSITPNVEKRLGTLQLAVSILWAILLSGFLYIAISWSVYALFGYEKLMYEHAVGFSGIIFHLSVLEARLLPGSRSIFGIINVPSYLYPWVLLIFLQMLVPHLSFLGHLCGILTGTFQSCGWLDCILIGDSYLIQMESWDSLRCITNFPSFVEHSRFQQHQQEPISITRAVKRGGAIVVKFVKDVLETFKVCIFGRGYRLNSNIRFGGGSGRTLNNDDWGPGRVLSPVNVLEEADDDEQEPLSRLV